MTGIERTGKSYELADEPDPKWWRSMIMDDYLSRRTLTSPPLGSDEFLEQGLALANMRGRGDVNAVDRFMWIARCGTRRTWTTVTSSKQARFEQLAVHRDWLVSILADAVTNIDAASSRHLPQIDVLSLDVIEIIRRDWVNGRRVSHSMVFARTERAVVAHVAALLFDSSLDYGRRLRRCALSDPDLGDELVCGRFFLLPRALGVGRPTVYCSPEHRAVGRSLSAQDRAKDYRARKAKKHK